jgi:signal transduction histidine kinase
LDLDQRARGTTTSLLNEVRNLSDMVTSFLNFARPQPLQFEEVNISELLAECCVELGPLFAERRVKLAADYSDRSPIVIGADERMLRQALLNLIRNAAEAIPESADARRVEVVARAEQDQSGKHWAVIEIEDTGQGVPESDLQRIFIPFFTTKAAGHGVGLALAYRVVTQHGGTLTAANSQTGGAIFTVLLPV